MKKSLELKEDIYKYMLAYSVSDFFYTLFVSFSWISRSGYSHSSLYIAKWYEIYIFFTSLNGLGTMSALVEIVITANRLLLVRKYASLDFTKKISANLIIVFMFLVSVGTAFLYAGVRSIKKETKLVFDIELNKTESIDEYSIYFNTFGKSDHGRLIYVIVTMLKNFGTTIVLVILNILLVVEMKKYHEKRNKLLGKVTAVASSAPAVNTVDNGVTTNTETNTQTASKPDPQMIRLVKMVFTMFILYMVGNLSNAVIGTLFIYYSKEKFFLMLLTFGDGPQFLCRGLNIFAYYHFNTRFREVLLKRFGIKNK